MSTNSETGREVAVCGSQDEAIGSQSSLRQLAQLNNLPGQLLTRVCNLNITDQKTLTLFDRIGCAALVYRKEDIKARRYVQQVNVFAEDIIMAFEGLKSEEYTQEEVFQDFIEDMEGSHDALLKPLQEVTSALETVADEVFHLITESGLLAKEYQMASRRFEAMKDLAADTSKDDAVVQGMSSMWKLLGFASSGASVVIAVFSVLSKAIASWGDYEHRKMKENEKLLTSLGDELSKVEGIMRSQQLLLQNLSDMIGQNMSKMQSKGEKRLTSGQSTSLTVDKIIHAGERLGTMCTSFLTDKN